VLNHEGGDVKKCNTLRAVQWGSVMPLLISGGSKMELVTGKNTS
jgi:hypothetical protein